jgi:hypothetical protein
MNLMLKGWKLSSVEKIEKTTERLQRGGANPPQLKKVEKTPGRRHMRAPRQQKHKAALAVESWNK